MKDGMTIRNGASCKTGNILDAIGDTPLVEVKSIYCKLEYLNPYVSIKARIARYRSRRPSSKVSSIRVTP
jgi:hypothetical protein